MLRRDFRSIAFASSISARSSAPTTNRGCKDSRLLLELRQRPFKNDAVEFVLFTRRLLRLEQSFDVNGVNLETAVDRFLPLDTPYEL